MKYKPFKQKNCKTVNELWELLSPTNELFQTKPFKLIYRGQANETWKLIPSLLRDNKSNQLMHIYKSKAKAFEQIFNEVLVLKKFVEYCNNVGIKIPNDSLKFREENLNDNNLDKFYRNPNLWPNEELFELMAMAQHHGVPTRLLDWTESPYVAVYFASSSAMKRYIELLENKESIDDKKIAIWVLNTESKNLYDLKIITPPRSLSQHLSAQKGLFTVHPHIREDKEGYPVIKGLEEDFATLPYTPLLKITLPLSESISLYNLCEKIGMTATTVFPNTQGIDIGIKDTLNRWHLVDNLLR